MHTITKKAMFHGNRQAAIEIFYATTPGDAKRTANRWFPRCNPGWNDIKFKVMEEICMSQAKQCDRYRSKLLNSGNRKLIHNMESDALWGFGDDGKGRNEMGNILMRVRHRLRQQSATAPEPTRPSYASIVSSPTKPTSTNPLPPSKGQQTGSSRYPTREIPSSTLRTTQQDRRRPHITVIGNSNVRGVAEKLIRLGGDASSYTYSGTPTHVIKERLKYCKPRHQRDTPSHVFLHTGDIDIRGESKQVITSVLNTIEDTINTFPNSRILVNTMPVLVRNPNLKSHIRKLNDAVREKCSSKPELTVIESENLPLRDNIHFSKHSIKELASMIMREVNYSN